MVTAIQAMKQVNATRPFGVCADISSSSGEVEITVMMKLCQRLLDGKRNAK